eukprot:6491902-Amphidinium_carterae.1
MDEVRDHPQLDPYRVTTRELNEETIEYITYLPGDTPDDERRRQQIHYLEDDIESIVAEEYYAKKGRGEPDPEQERKVRDRHVRRQQRRKAGLPERYQGNKEDLRRMRNALIALTVSGRRQRLQERERTRPQPKAAPQGVRVPVYQSIFTKEINKMAMQELRAAIQEGEDLKARHQGGIYTAPPLPSLQKWKDRLDILETQQQEEQDRLEHHRRIEAQVRRQEAEHIAALQAQRQEAAERAEKAHQEELDRQAAMTEIPAEQVAQEPEQAVPPLIGEGQGQAQSAQVITSSTASSTSTSNSRATARLVRQEEEDEREYWDNIVDIKYTTYNDEIDPEELLHEGVLYWMSMEDIKDLQERARSTRDPEAEQQYKEYLENDHKLDLKMREEYEKYKGSIEEREDFQQALEDKDAEAIQEIVYEYAKGARERKAQWKREKLKDDEKKKEAWLKEVLREQATIIEENDKQEIVQEGAATSSATAVAGQQESTEERKKTPPRPNRAPPIPASQRVPPTPGALPEVPGLSPRL